ncbi:hypothetical protein GE061_003419 [Apolygus lucorum]|uniref:C2H2-type domain-containing protein n=1 Tax=Apolygus lucorum TaxID=248454 RepID=A0A8S9X1Y8_APOLU|nr:hypothetical protein GE061_003419 [Apolygus lucorum]
MGKTAEIIGPQIHERSKFRLSWGKDDMARAIYAVRDGVMGTAKASKIFRVPRSTLQTLAKRTHLTPLEAAQKDAGSGKAFSYSCRCGSKFNHLRNYKYHVSHQCGVVFRCPVCGKNFTRKFSMKQHLQMIHGSTIIMD